MEELFGVDIDILAGVSTSIMIVAVLIVAVLGFRNKLLVKMAIRNIPRRPAQSVVIMFGLTLSTAIICAALSIGDTVTTSIRYAVLQGLGNSDIYITSTQSSVFGDNYLDKEDFDIIKSKTSQYDEIDGFAPFIREDFSVYLPSTEKTNSQTLILGFDKEYLSGFGDINLPDGKIYSLTELNEGEVVISGALSSKIDAKIGDTLNIVTPTGKYPFMITVVAARGNLAASDPRVLMNISELQTILNRPGQFNNISISTTGTQDECIQRSKELSEKLYLDFSDKEMASDIFNILSTTEVTDSLNKFILDNDNLPQSIKDDMDSLVTELDSGTMSDEFIKLIGDQTNRGVVLGALEDSKLTNEIQSVGPLLYTFQDYNADPIKYRLNELANTVGTSITTFFSIFGTYSITVGLLLIFLVFILLAASRSTEMGISRAIGMKRTHLTQMFTFEGTAYALAAASLGTLIGVLASYSLVSIGLSALSSEDDGFVIKYSLNIRALALAFSSGMLLTFITVVISSYRVSKLNIVVAIRNLPEQFAKDKQVSTKILFFSSIKWLLGPIYLLAIMLRDKRVLTITNAILCFIWVGLIVSVFAVPDQAVQNAFSLWLIVTLWKIITIILRFFKTGWPLLILGPIVLFTVFGFENSPVYKDAALFGSGVSLTLLGIGLTLRWMLNYTSLLPRVIDRLAASITGLTLAIFWGMPFDTLESITGKLEDSPLTFVLPGLWLVVSVMTVIMYNAEIIVWIGNKTFGAISSFKAVFKISVAYPMASRFRTGLTVTMFALVIFTLVIFATLNNLGNEIQDNPERVSGGYEIRANINRETPIENVYTTINNSDIVKSSDFEFIASQTNFRAQARQEGTDNSRFKNASIKALDTSYLETNLLQITHYDPAYGTDSRAIWNALAKDSTLALIRGDALATANQGGPGAQSSDAFRLDGVEAAEQGEMTSQFIELQLPLGQGVYGEIVTRKIIGVVDPIAGGLDGFDGQGRSAIYTNTDLVKEISPIDITPNVYRFKLTDPAQDEEIARKLETVFLENSMQATAIVTQLADQRAQDDAFNLLFQGFQGLGLIVGVAALGVISFRAVVERRRVIGMMKAMGYSRRMIQFQFLLESAVIAILGSIVGIGLGTLVSWNIVEEIRKTVEDLTFEMPWVNLIGITSITVLFALIATWVPAIQASRIYPAEALTYE